MSTDWFFGVHIDPISLLGKAMVLCLAVLLGGLIGLERQMRGNPAGLRTHIMVSVGATVITLASVEIGMGVRGGMRGDPGHIAAQIVSGVGFLGAGAIMRDGVTVRGLTTAASIWATAGIGIALGASPRLGELGVLATVIVLFTLSLLGYVERRMKVGSVYSSLEVEVIEANRGVARVLDTLTGFGFVVHGVGTDTGSSATEKGEMRATKHVHVRLVLPAKFDRNAFNHRIMEEEGVVSFHLE